ncbi:MAG: hypothetical protein UX57_C0001G0056 [Candidatus Uhrbacteria bacterium GW2011_GWE2_46_68]|uniref:NIF system FeS cluster assembly NifU C-terminal domain-containing protein n=2 Tax=Candidatus Uhriibacteriota TaxID=1752732 RepID=A0A0G1QAK9_9BACT|nr:MAG: hypothetical protein UX45_C0002G0057 [Candidatus Uhrbacteria bacterium GW2011_GWF2_46_218]KKU41832.1 MAG: hypothetical protein UX57_C0001G0056 [Candidatus Uhrbacteria bacterium GW2011_GWE2_46_68]
MLQEEMLKKIEEALVKIRPLLAQDGGDIELLSFDPGTQMVTVRFLGACQGCPMAQFTLQRIIKTTIQESCPFVTDVILNP